MGRGGREQDKDGIPYYERETNRTWAKEQAREGRLCAAIQEQEPGSDRS